MLRSANSLHHRSHTYLSIRRKTMGRLQNGVGNLGESDSPKEEGERSQCALIACTCRTDGVPFAVLPTSARTASQATGGCKCRFLYHSSAVCVAWEKDGAPTTGLLAVKKWAWRVRKGCVSEWLRENSRRRRYENLVHERRGQVSTRLSLSHSALLQRALTSAVSSEGETHGNGIQQENTSPAATKTLIRGFAVTRSLWIEAFPIREVTSARPFPTM